MQTRINATSVIAGADAPLAPPKPRAATAKVFVDGDKDALFGPDTATESEAAPAVDPQAIAMVTDGGTDQVSARAKAKATAQSRVRPGAGPHECPTV